MLRHVSALTVGLTTTLILKIVTFNHNKNFIIISRISTIEVEAKAAHAKKNLQFP
jgi:hypothetical protein